MYGIGASCSAATMPGGGGAVVVVMAVTPPAERAGRRSLRAAGHPLGDLGGEEVEGQRARGRVGVDVLALALAAVHVEGLRRAERGAAPQGDRDGLGHDGTLERLRG